jgi:predicted DNA binding CopG/RHH family protein
MKKYASEDTFINEVLAEFTFWKPKKNKTVKLQVRVSKETLNKMFGPMNKKGFTDYSKYIRDLIIKDVDN